jgi:hypothetical protein
MLHSLLAFASAREEVAAQAVQPFATAYAVVLAPWPVVAVIVRLAFAARKALLYCQPTQMASFQQQEKYS